MFDYKVSITVFIRKPLRLLDHYPSASVVLSVPDVLFILILPQQPPFFHHYPSNNFQSINLAPVKIGGSVFHGWKAYNQHSQQDYSRQYSAGVRRKDNGLVEEAMGR